MPSDVLFWALQVLHGSLAVHAEQEGLSRTAHWRTLVARTEKNEMASHVGNAQDWGIHPLPWPELRTLSSQDILPGSHNTLDRHPVTGLVVGPLPNGETSPGCWTCLV